ncbi:MAG: efflux RND transporter periplasmic adaptor subunit [Proteobacteria bacterium]|nr:efflux RND transporter periplasmic adaptor subunit [Pseudomonadota bacterium]
MKPFILILLISLLVACSSKEENKAVRSVEVTSENLHKSLYFTGTISPLKESSLISPMDAIVETVHCHYGQWVKKGELIYTLNSTALQKQYNDTLTEYLKSKDSYTIAKTKFAGTKDLWQAGLLSKNNFLSEKSSLATARISLMQATQKLSEMLEKMDESGKDLSKLNMAEFDKVRQALTVKHNLIYLRAPMDGILLYPPKTSENHQKLMVGTQAKAGEVLALIGDLQGISIEIDVPEIDIDKVYRGMSATITGVALNNKVLHGELIAVNAQASQNNNGNLPSFNALVEVKNLTKEEQALIKVGMSASIELSVDKDKQLLVPISALKQEEGKSIVKLKQKDGSFKKHPVTTGLALADRVVIQSGLKEKDVIAYD